MLCVCVRGKRGEKRKHKIDKRENEVLKKKVYINKENMRYKDVAHYKEQQLTY